MVDLLLAGGVAVLMHPLIREIGYYVAVWFPISPQKQELLERLSEQMSNPVVAVLVFALMPAIAEELAFRGYMLSGLRRGYRVATAVLISAFLFAFLHAIISLFQQFFSALVLGLILGIIALRTGSLFPGSVLHFTSNSLAVLLPAKLAATFDRPWVGWTFRDPEHYLFQLPVLIGATLAALGLLALIVRGNREPGVDAPTDPEGLIR